jgi:UDP-3-O-[3-hydroxymyristoyl] glucosamine N-acyltransferase
VLRIGAIEDARAAQARGALLLVDASVAGRVRGDWIHAHGAWVLASLLDRCDAALPPPRVGQGATVHPTAVLYPGVVLGARARVEPYAVVGGAGFGWVEGRDGRARHMPHLGGVFVGEDACIGSHTTVHAGVLTPTLIGARARLDAHVHVGHNCEVGDDCFLAAQVGLAGSVVLGRGVLVGGQAGIADHVHVGDRARIAAKSGVIGNVPARATFGGDPATHRVRWLRGVAFLESAARLDRKTRS